MAKRIDYYDVLGVAPNADAEVIRAAYRALAKKYHPDSRGEGKAEAEKKLRELNEAYGVLCNEVSRERYNRERSTTTKSTNFEDSNKTERRSAGNTVEWKVIETRYPEVGFKYKQLQNISPTLANTYLDRMVRERAFTRYDQISSELINQFASRRFGSSKTLQQFGLWCLSNDKRGAALELNQTIAKHGTPQDLSQLLSQLRAKHHIPSAGLRRMQNTAYIPKVVKLVMIAFGGLLIAAVVLSVILLN